MKLRTKRQLIDGVAAAWKAQYWHPLHGWMYSTPQNDKEAFYKELAELPPGATETQVTAVLGQQTWTENKCNECQRDVDVLIHLGEDPDYDSVTFYLCPACAAQAVALSKDIP